MNEQAERIRFHVSKDNCCDVIFYNGASPVAIRRAIKMLEVQHEILASEEEEQQHDIGETS